MTDNQYDKSFQELLAVRVGADRAPAEAAQGLMAQQAFRDLVRTHATLRLVDEVSAKGIADSGATASCREGCHWCCYEPVEATVVEGYLAAGVSKRVMFFRQQRILKSPR